MEPPSRFRHDLRHENVLYPSHSILHHLPPTPPPPTLSHLQALPPSFLPPRYEAHRLYTSSVTCSPPHQRILQRSHVCDFTLPGLPQFDSFLCPKPPQPPLPHLENVPFRLIRDYPYSNPRLEDGMPIQRYADTVTPNSSRTWDGSLLLGQREYNYRDSDIGHRDRCNNSWDSNSEYRGLLNNRSFQTERRDFSIHDNRELYCEIFEGALRHRRDWECGIREGPDLCIEGHRRFGYGIDDRILSQVDKGKDLLESNSNLSRFSGKSRREVTERDFNRNKKIKTNVFHRIQPDLAGQKHYKSRKISKNGRGVSWNGKERSFCRKEKRILKTEVKDKHEAEQSEVALSISFNSNSLVANTFLVASGSNNEEGMNSSAMSIKAENNNFTADLTPTCPSISDGLVVTEPCRGFQSDMQGTQTELPEKLNLYGKERAMVNDAIKHSVHNCDSIVISKHELAESNDRVAYLGTDRVNEINENASCDDFASLENASVGGPSEIPDLVGGENVKGLSKPLESRSSENHQNRQLSEYHESPTSSMPETVLFKNIDNAISFDIRSTNENLKESFIDQVSIPEMEICTLPKAVEARILERAVVANCFGDVGASEGPSFRLEDFEGVTSKVDTGYLDSTIKKSYKGVDNILNESIDVERSLEAVDHLKTYFCVDYLPKSKRKRKISASQMVISGSNDIVLSNMGSSTDGQLGNNLSINDVSSSKAVGCSGMIGSFEVDSSLIEGFSGDSDLPHDSGDFSADRSIQDQLKKRKVVIPGFIPTSHSKVDQVVKCPSSDSPKLDQISPLLPEWGSKQGDEAASVDITGGKENFAFLAMYDSLVDDAKLHFNQDSTFFSGTLSACNRNYASEREPNDASMTSDFDLPSYMSSPENLLSHTDFSSSIFSVKPSSGRNCSLFSDNSTENAASYQRQTSAKVSQSLPQNTGKRMHQCKQMQGKPSSSKNQITSSSNVFTRKPATMFNTAMQFPSAPVAKSRTWHRTSHSSVTVAAPNLQSLHPPPSLETKTKHSWNSYIRQGNSLVRKPSSIIANSAKFPSLDSSVSHLSSSMDHPKKNQSFYVKGDALTRSRLEQVNASKSLKSLPPYRVDKSWKGTSSLLKKSLPVESSLKDGCPQKTFIAPEQILKSSADLICGTGLVNNSDIPCTVGQSNVGKEITYVKRRSNQLVAACDPENSSKSGPEKLVGSSFDKYYKKRKNQLIRVPLETSVKDNGNTMRSVSTYRLKSQTKVSKSFGKHQPGYNKTCRPSKFSLVWKLHESQLSDKSNKTAGPKKLWPYVLPWKKSTYRNCIHALGSRLNMSGIRRNSLLSSSRGAIYTRSTHGYSLKISKVLSVGGYSLKWSKSIERNSKKANKEATLAVAAAEKKKKEGRASISTVSKKRENVYRKSVLCVKLHPGERIFRVGLERYKMDPTRRTLHRIIAEEEASSSSAIQSEKNFKRAYVPKRLLIGNDEYVRIGNGNQLVRDPKKRIQALASEMVRWSLRTARLRLVRNKKYCQFFTRFGKCNKSDGKCPYIHDTSKIAVCTKFLNGSCPDPECKLTHKVIPERMPDCSYYLKGSCSNENCPYRHVKLNPNSSICKGFLRGYCADGNKCRKKHTYVCPAYESKGICPQDAACKLHHPKKKIIKKLTNEKNIVRGRYFDGGLVDTAEFNLTSETHSTKGSNDTLCRQGKYPDYISLALSNEEEE